MEIDSATGVNIVPFSSNPKTHHDGGFAIPKHGILSNNPSTHVPTSIRMLGFWKKNLT